MAVIHNPMQTVLVSSRYNDKDNLITLDWHMPTSIEPSLYAISVGKKRFSYELISKSKVFVVNFMPFHLEKEVLFCGRNSGKHIDKFKETGLKREEGEKVDCPRIKQASAFMECEVINEIETGDHIIFIGKVLYSDWKDKGKRLFHVEADSFTTTVE